MPPLVRRGGPPRYGFVPWKCSGAPVPVATEGVGIAHPQTAEGKATLPHAAASANRRPARRKARSPRMPERADPELVRARGARRHPPRARPRAIGALSWRRPMATGVSERSKAKLGRRLTPPRPSEGRNINGPRRRARRWLSMAVPRGRDLGHPPRVRGVPRRLSVVADPGRRRGSRGRRLESPPRRCPPASAGPCRQFRASLTYCPQIRRAIHPTMTANNRSTVLDQAAARSDRRPVADGYSAHPSTRNLAGPSRLASPENIRSDARARA